MGQILVTQTRREDRAMPVTGPAPTAEPPSEPLSEAGNKSVIFDGGNGVDSQGDQDDDVDRGEGKCSKTKCDRKKSSNCSFSSKILLCGSESKRKEIVDENNPQSASSDGQTTSKGRKSCRKGSKKNNSKRESIPLNTIEQAPPTNEDPSSQASGHNNVPSDQSAATASVNGVNNKNNKSCCFCWCCCCSCSW